MSEDRQGARVCSKCSHQLTRGGFVGHMRRVHDAVVDVRQFDELLPPRPRGRRKKPRMWARTHGVALARSADIRRVQAFVYTRAAMEQPEGTFSPAAEAYRAWYRSQKPRRLTCAGCAARYSVRIEVRCSSFPSLSVWACAACVAALKRMEGATTISTSAVATGAEARPEPEIEWSTVGDVHISAQGQTRKRGSRRSER